jgi:hypothetical protein
VFTFSANLTKEESQKQISVQNRIDSIHLEKILNEALVVEKQNITIDTLFK